MPINDYITGYAVANTKGVLLRTGQCETGVLEYQTDRSDFTVIPIPLNKLDSINLDKEYWDGKGLVPYPKKPDAQKYEWNGTGWDLLPEPEPEEEPEEDLNLLRVEIVSRRNSLLSGSDWTQMADSPLTPEKKAEWVIYRQALRDITLQEDFSNIIWPERPE